MNSKKQRYLKLLIELLVWLMIPVGILGAIGLCLFYILFLLDTSGNQILTEIISPDGRNKAVIFERDAGATTGFSTQVSVIGAKSSLRNRPGNIFVADDNRGAAPSGPGGGPEVKVKWVSANELVVSHHPRARIFHSEEKIRSIRIKYEDFAETTSIK